MEKEIKFNGDELSELISATYSEWENIINERSDDDYKVDSNRMEELTDVVQNIYNLTETNDVSIEKISMIPREENAWITFSFSYLYINGMDYVEFLKSMISADAIEIDATLDGVIHVSVLVKKLFVHK